MYSRIDERLPGQTRCFFTKTLNERLMLVPEKIRRSVVFLAFHEKKDDDPDVGARRETVVVDDKECNWAVRGTALCMTVENESTGQFFT